MKNLFYLLFALPLLFSCGGDEEVKGKEMSFCDCWEMQIETQKNFTNDKYKEWENKCTEVMNLSPKALDHALAECK